MAITQTRCYAWITTRQDANTQSIYMAAVVMVIVAIINCNTDYIYRFPCSALVRAMGSTLMSDLPGWKPSCATLSKEAGQRQRNHHSLLQCVFEEAVVSAKSINLSNRGICQPVKPIIHLGDHGPKRVGGLVVEPCFIASLECSLQEGARAPPLPCHTDYLMNARQAGAFLN